MARKTIPDKTMTEIFVRSRRRCCLCYGLSRDFNIKNGQIAHIDRNNGNPDFDNLAYLCLEHHDQYDSSRSQSKGFTKSELKYYRDELYKKVAGEFNMLNDFLNGAEFLPTHYNGVYAYRHPVMEATLTIRHIKDDVYSIEGMALYGLDRPYGPNMGQLSEVGKLQGNVLSYAGLDPETNEIEYGIRIEFIKGGISVTEAGKEGGFNARFGAGARFSGEYEKIGY